MYILVNEENNIITSTDNIASVPDNLKDKVIEIPNITKEEAFSKDHLYNYIDGEIVINIEDEKKELESKLNYIRLARKDLLASSDWTQGADVPANIKEPYATYRQTLRDLPSTITSWNSEIVWPTKPLT